MSTYDKPPAANCLPYFRALFYLQPVNQVLGRKINADPQCQPFVAVWHAYTKTLMPLMPRPNVWHEDVLFLVVEEVWRLRPTDAGSMLARWV